MSLVCARSSCVQNLAQVPIQPKRRGVNRLEAEEQHEKGASCQYNFITSREDFNGNRQRSSHWTVSTTSQKRTARTRLAVASRFWAPLIWAFNGNQLSLASAVEFEASTRQLVAVAFNTESSLFSNHTFSTLKLPT